MSEINKNAQAQEAWRLKQAGKGLRRLQVMCLESDVEKIKAYVERLNTKGGVPSKKKRAKK